MQYLLVRFFFAIVVVIAAAAAAARVVVVLRLLWNALAMCVFSSCICNSIVFHFIFGIYTFRFRSNCMCLKLPTSFAFAMLPHDVMSLPDTQMK